MSSTLYWFMVLIVGLGVRHLALHLPIPTEMIRRYREEEAERQQAALAVREADDVSADDEGWVRRRDDDDADSDFCSDPSFNIDGTPMLGDLDVNGNPFGVTDDW